MEGRKRPRWAVAPSSPQLSVSVRSRRGCHRCRRRLQRAICLAAMMVLLGSSPRSHQRRSRLLLADAQNSTPPATPSVGPTPAADIDLPTPPPTPVPTTSNPSAPPSAAVPATPPPTPSPVTAAPTSRPTRRPTTPRPTDRPTVHPTSVPSSFPSYLPTAQPTYPVRGDVLVPLSIELYGVGRLGSRATNVFEEGTSAHIEKWYNGGANGSAVAASSSVFEVEVETRLIGQEQISVDELRQRQGLDVDGGGDGGGDGSPAADGGTGGGGAGEDQGGGGGDAQDSSSVGEVSVVTYVQNITYRTTDDTVTPLDLATDPFSTAAGKEAYMQILKAPSETTVFDDMYNVSDVTLGNLDDIPEDPPKRTEAVEALTMTLFPMRGPMEVTAQAVWATTMNKFMQGYWERALVAGGSTIVSLEVVSLVSLQVPPLPSSKLTLPPMPPRPPSTMVPTEAPQPEPAPEPAPVPEPEPAPVPEPEGEPAPEPEPAAAPAVPEQQQPEDTVGPEDFVGPEESVVPEESVGPEEGVGPEESVGDGSGGNRDDGADSGGVADDETGGEDGAGGGGTRRLELGSRGGPNGAAVSRGGFTSDRRDAGRSSRRRRRRQQQQEPATVPPTTQSPSPPLPPPPPTRGPTESPTVSPAPTDAPTWSPTSPPSGQPSEGASVALHLVYSQVMTYQSFGEGGEVNLGTIAMQPFNSAEGQAAFVTMLRETGDPAFRHVTSVSEVGSATKSPTRSPSVSPTAPPSIAPSTSPTLTPVPTSPTGEPSSAPSAFLPPLRDRLNIAAIAVPLAFAAVVGGLGAYWLYSRRRRRTREGDDGGATKGGHNRSSSNLSFVITGNDAGVSASMRSRQDWRAEGGKNQGGSPHTDPSSQGSSPETATRQVPQSDEDGAFMTVSPIDDTVLMTVTPIDDYVAPSGQEH